MSKTVSVGAFLAMVTAATVYGGDVTGKVVLKGTPKPEIKIDMSADPKCGAMHEQPVSTRHYVVGADGGLANVLVYVKEGLKDKNFAVPAEPVELNQQGCEYQPYVSGLMVNQKLKIVNSDPTLHNVHATPKAGSANKEFNFAQPTKGMSTEKTFTAVEVPVRFKCDVHPWMFAYVGVFDHPFFAVTDKDGNFTIKGLPAGKYTLEAYHVKTHGQNPGVTQEVSVDGNAKADFTVELK
jgi:plastocyanin